MQGDSFLDWLNYLSFGIKVEFKYQKSRYYGQVLSERQKSLLLAMMDRWAFMDEERFQIEDRINSAKEEDFEELMSYLSNPVALIDLVPYMPMNDDLTKCCVIWEGEIITLTKRAKKTNYDYNTDHEQYKYFKLKGWKHPKFYSADQRNRVEFDAYLMTTTTDKSNLCKVLILAA